MCLKMIYALLLLLFNYRLIILNILIYDSIAHDVATIIATRKKSITNLTIEKLLPTAQNNSISASPFFMSNRYSDNTNVLKQQSVDKALNDLSLHKPKPSILTMMEHNHASNSCNNLTTNSHLRATNTLQHKWQNRLSRPKRYLAFPEGSSFSVAVCLTVGIVGNPRYNYMSFGVNWGVAYDLPNSTWMLNHLYNFALRPLPSAALRRRTRRSLFNDIEILVNNMGYNGQDCLLRALCESRHYFQRTKMGMIGEMLRVIFSLPKQRIYTRELHENADILLYDTAYREARSVNCAKQYNCQFSLLELALGKYSTPPKDYYAMK